MMKKNLRIIPILLLSIILLVSGCTKPEDSTPIEPTEPDTPKETTTDTSLYDNNVNIYIKSSY